MDQNDRHVKFLNGKTDDIKAKVHCEGKWMDIIIDGRSLIMTHYRPFTSCHHFQSNNSPFPSFGPFTLDLTSSGEIKRSDQPHQK